MRRTAATLAAALTALAPAVPASADWHPPDLRTARPAAPDGIAACAKAAGAPDARYAQRRERWTYAVGGRVLPVRVAVRGDDFRAAVPLGDAEYSAGRWGGIRWRADANGIAHATLADDQGDAVDRLPQSVFPFALADCELAGESERFGPAWVLVDRAPRDKPHWFYVDKSTGRIAHEITREGARTIVTSFGGFEPLGTMLRPRRWHVSDGDRAHDLDVTVEDIEARRLEPIDVAIPQKQRTFAPRGGARDTIALPAHFRGRTIVVDVDLDGEPAEFLLDTGTASVTLDARIAERRRWPVSLEHATVPRMGVGALSLENVSTLAMPLRLSDARRHPRLRFLLRARRPHRLCRAARRGAHAGRRGAGVPRSGGDGDRGVVRRRPPARSARRSAPRPATASPWTPARRGCSYSIRLRGAIPTWWRRGAKRRSARAASRRWKATSKGRSPSRAAERRR